MLFSVTQPVTAVTFQVQFPANQESERQAPVFPDNPNKKSQTWLLSDFQYKISLEQKLFKGNNFQQQRRL